MPTFVMDQDLALAAEEVELANTLAVELGLEHARRDELIAISHQLIHAAR